MYGSVFRAVCSLNHRRLGRDVGDGQIAAMRSAAFSSPSGVLSDEDLGVMGGKQTNWQWEVLPDGKNDAVLTLL